MVLFNRKQGLGNWEDAPLGPTETELPDAFARVRVKDASVSVCPTDPKIHFTRRKTGLGEFAGVVGE